MAGVLLALAACGTAPQEPAASPGGVPLVLPAMGQRRAGPGPAAPAGLQPLPVPAQVARALPIGRFDPFARLGDPPAAAAASPTPRVPPQSEARALTKPLSKPKPLAKPQLRPGSGSGASSRGATAGAGPFCPGLPPDFRFTGVIRGGGRAYAVVEADGISGSLQAGDRGGGTTDLLPPCWSVARVDVNRGLLELQQGRRRWRVEL